MTLLVIEGQTDMSIFCKGIEYKWQGAQQALLSIEAFELKSGDKVFLSGPSGSGKTTLLSLIGGVLLPSQGSIEILGKNICDLSGSQRDQIRADHIGFIFQQFNLLPYLSVLENVQLPLRFSKTRLEKLEDQSKSGLDQEAVRLLKELGLHDDALYKKSVNQLSVGQQQRVAVARAFIGSPEIIVADEPTSALDQDAREAFLKLMFKECERQNTTLLYVSHDKTIAPMFDRVEYIESFKAKGAQ